MATHSSASSPMEMEDLGLGTFLMDEDIQRYVHVLSLAPMGACGCCNIDNVLTCVAAMAWPPPATTLTTWTRMAIVRRSLERSNGALLRYADTRRAVCTHLQCTAALRTRRCAKRTRKTRVSRNHKYGKQFQLILETNLKSSA